MVTVSISALWFAAGVAVRLLVIDIKKYGLRPAQRRIQEQST